MKLPYLVGGSIMRAHDAALLSPGEDPQEALLQSILDTISTDVEVTLGGVTVFLAMLLDPDHWSTDWEERGIEDVDAFLADLVEEA